MSLLSCCGIVPHGPHKSAARVRRVVPCRDHIYLRDAREGVLRRLADLESVPGMTADLMSRLQSMMEEAEQFGGYMRE